MRKAKGPLGQPCRQPGCTNEAASSRAQFCRKCFLVNAAFASSQRQNFGGNTTDRRGHGVLGNKGNSRAGGEQTMSGRRSPLRGQPRKSQYCLAPSQTPYARRAKRKSMAGQDVVEGGKRRQTAARKRPVCEHRKCFRCRKRDDWCRERGCLPVKFKLVRKQFRRFLDAFDSGNVESAVGR